VFSKPININKSGRIAPYIYIHTYQQGFNGSGWESVTLAGWQEEPMTSWFSKMEIDQDIQKYMAWSTFNCISLQTIIHGSDSRFNRWHIYD